MVKGETGTLTLDVRAAVDKGVSVFASAIFYVKNVKILELLLLGESYKSWQECVHSPHVLITYCITVIIKCFYFCLIAHMTFKIILFMQN